MLTPGEILEGTPLVIRFYDTVSKESASYFNAVTDSAGLWNWKSSGTPVTLTLSLADSALVWQGGAGSAFRTAVPVPEPGAVWLAVPVVLALAAGRRPLD